MRRYAAAWGILLGTAVGAAIGIPLNASHLVGTLSLAGLIVGYVISQQGQPGGDPTAGGERSKGPAIRERLECLDDLRSAGLITEEEYARKRRAILDEL